MTGKYLRDGSLVAGHILKILLTLGAFITYFIVSLRFYGIIGAAVHPLSLIPVVIAGLTMGLRAGLLFSLLGASLNVLIVILGSSYAASVPDWKLLASGIFVQVVVGIVVGRMRDLGVRVKEQIRILQSVQHLLEENVNGRKHMEDQLSRQRVFLESIIDNFDNGVAAVDAEGKQIVVNKALCEMTGFQKEELLGATPPFKYWAEESLDDIFSAFNQVLEGVPRNVTVTFKRKNGERFLAFVSAMKLVTPDCRAFLVEKEGLYGEGWVGLEKRFRRFRGTPLHEELSQRLLQSFLDVVIASNLIAVGELTGYEIVLFLHGKYGVLYSPGTVYPILHGMAKRGLIKTQILGRRKPYVVTDKGRLWYEINSKEFPDIMKVLMIG